MQRVKGKEEAKRRVRETEEETGLWGGVKVEHHET